MASSNLNYKQSQRGKRQDGSPTYTKTLLSFPLSPLCGSRYLRLSKGLDSNISKTSAIHFTWTWNHRFSTFEIQILPETMSFEFSAKHVDNKKDIEHWDQSLIVQFSNSSTSPRNLVVSLKATLSKNWHTRIPSPLFYGQLIMCEYFSVPYSCN